MDRDEHGNALLPIDAVFAVSLEDALARTWPTDAHACQYAPVEINGVRLRLPGSAVEAENLAAIGGAVRMVARFGDIDDPVAHAEKTPARASWRAETLPKIQATGLAHYETKGGYRLVERLPAGCTIESRSDASDWSQRYLGWREWLRAEFGIVIDVACKDWTRLYRLPNVVRDGVAVAAPVVGAITLTDWTHYCEHPAEAKPARERTATSSGAPVAAEDEIGAVLGPREDHSGEVWPLVGAAGGVLRKLATSRARGDALFTKFLATHPNPKKWHDWAMAAWDKPAESVSGRKALSDIVGVELAEAFVAKFAHAWGAPLVPSDGAVFSGDVEGSSFSGHAILRSRDGHVTLLWDGDDRGYQPIAPAVIRNRIQELPIASMMVLSEGKRQKSIPAILDEYGRTYTKTVYDFSKARTEYDENGDGLVVIGFPPRGPAAAFDRDADAWLRALGGELYPRLEAWLASCAQRHIDRLAACLIVIGEADVGKSLLAQAVARTWGAAPPAMGLVVERFNGDMLTCPVLVDEEAQLFGSGGLSSKRFRDIAQARSRPIEHKGKEKVLLVGAQRYIVGCNGVGDIRFRDLEGGGVIGALHDRLLVVNALERTDVCRDALARLRLPGSYEADLMRIAAHVAWLGATITPAAERFIGSGGSAGTGVVLAGHAAQNVAILDMLQTWLDSSDRKEGVWFNDRAADLLVDPKALTEELMRATRSLASPGETGWTRAKVETALTPFRAGTHTIRLRIGTTRHRAWALNRDRLRAAGVDLDGYADHEK